MRAIRVHLILRSATMRFEKKTAIVTGAGGGIGEAYARALHAEGANVVIAELDQERGQAVADDLGDRALFVGGLEIGRAHV